jgi:hypothetical protein
MLVFESGDEFSYQNGNYFLSYFIMFSPMEYNWNEINYNL